MTRKPKLGATGAFPHGKLNKDDEGELRLAIGITRNGLVRIDFGKPVAWLAMTKADAVEFAGVLLKHAREQ